MVVGGKMNGGGLVLFFCACNDRTNDLTTVENSR